MSTNFQSSFIPKDPTNEESFGKEKPNLITSIGIMIFILAIISAGGLFIYKRILNNKNTELKALLVESENNINRNDINEVLRFDRKLSYSKNLVAKHEVITNFLKDLASNTAVSVFFDDFTYGNLDNTGLSVSLKGSAVNYAGVAFQESVFLNNSNYKKVVFSNLRLGENGRVSFDVYLQIDPKIITYIVDSEALSTENSQESVQNLEEIEDFEVNQDSIEVSFNVNN
jgi:hypothetical protein